jgi:hypothetical protein
MSIAWPEALKLGHPDGTTRCPLRKSETRNPKSETNSKGKKTANVQNSPVAAVLNIFGFEFWVCFGFRVSDFGFDGFRVVVPTSVDKVGSLICPEK